MRFKPGFAPAKINLALHVTGPRADGYHLLDSLVAFADVGDLLTATRAERASLKVTGPMAEGVPDGPTNLVLKAAAFSGVTAAFTLEKHLPAAAGIGGGSSDAAAALRLIKGMGGAWEGNPAELGADVPVCLTARAARMEGVGEQVTPLEHFPMLHAVLANPRFDVLTSAIFKTLTHKTNSPLPPLPAFKGADQVIAYLRQTRNDLEPPACAQAPQINGVLTALGALQGCMLARMSGSGATCFALFPTAQAASSAANALSAAHEDWWITATTLG